MRALTIKVRIGGRAQNHTKQRISEVLRGLLKALVQVYYGFEKGKVDIN